MQPTDEQLHALSLFQTGQSLKIEAGAGTGKTTTLKLLAESTPRFGQYVAFNKAIVDESKERMPKTVRCNTAHSLAFAAVGKNFVKRLDASQRMKSWELARVLQVNGMWVEAFTGEKRNLSPGFLAGLVMRSIERFCQSADPEPTAFHVPLVPGLDAPPSAVGPARYPVNNAVAASLVPTMKFAWEELRRYEGTLPFKHSHYLKIWQLSRPRLTAQYILFDEAQDASPVLMDVVVRQEHAQLVWVGDSQQAIYEFTGAVNALAKIPSDHTAYLTQSFRFGPAIADVANEVLGRLQAPLRLTGFEEIESTVGAVAEPKAILTRTNATAVRTVLETLALGRTVHLVGGGSEITSFVRAAERLMDGQRVEHPELACFETWAEVKEYVEEDEQGGDLRLLVDLIEEFGVEKILLALDNTISESRADLIVSTAHKSKGREWETVRLANDFEDKSEPAELRLLYVACTRARMRLDRAAVTAVAQV